MKFLNWKTAGIAAVVMAPAMVLSQNINVNVNGEQVMFAGVGPQQVQGRVLVPLRGVLEKLGAYVQYDSATKTVMATKSGTDLQLRIGDRRAVVNGREVFLDVPAQTYRGSTMVPLRFVGEALGAAVKWNAATYTVDISAAASTGDPNTYTPPTTPPPTGTTNPPIANNPNITITGFDVDQSGTLRGGSTIRFTLQGTPGARASVSIPGVANEIMLTESQSGVYVGSYTVPSNTALTISRASAIGRLTSGNAERLIQSGTMIAIDNQPPTITSITPEPSSRVTRNRPNISAVFDDASGSGIDPATVELRIDNRIVTGDAQVTGTFVAYRPDNPLSSGAHEVVLSARDKAGNQVSRSWAFTVTGGADVIRSFTFDAAGQPLTPGTDVTFTMLGEPGGTATFMVGNRERTMREVEPGRYVGSYTIRRNDNFNNLVVSGKLVTRSGETFTTESNSRFSTSVGRLEAPSFTSHTANERLSNNQLILRGNATPGSKVQIRVDYVKNALGLLRLNGTVGEFEVTADDRGVFETKQINLDTGLGGGDTTYTITAVTIGADGTKSEPTTLTLKR